MNNFLFIKSQVGLRQNQYRLNIFFQHLNHETLRPPHVEVCIQTLHYTRLIHMDGYHLLVRHSAALFAAKRPAAWQNIHNNASSLIRRLKNHPISGAGIFVRHPAIKNISRQFAEI